MSTNIQILKCLLMNIMLIRIDFLIVIFYVQLFCKNSLAKSQWIVVCNIESWTQGRISNPRAMLRYTVVCCDTWTCSKTFIHRMAFLEFSVWCTLSHHLRWFIVRAFPSSSMITWSLQFLSTSSSASWKSLNLSWLSLHLKEGNVRRQNDTSFEPRTIV